MRLDRSGATLLSLALVAGFPDGAARAAPGDGPDHVTFAFTRAMFGRVPENDARAAISVYSKVIAGDYDLDPGQAIVLDGRDAIAAALRQNQADLLALTTEEFLAFEGQLEGPLLVTNGKHGTAEEYLLLARADGPIQKVEDLRGRSLTMSSDIRASLAPVWLEILSRRHGLGPSGTAFPGLVQSPTVTQVLLPVFFGKADACIVTRTAFETMGDLNPQVKERLRVVAQSPPVVPTVSGFRRGMSESLKQRAIKAAMGASGTPTFRQLLMLFKTEALSVVPADTLESTRQLMAEYARATRPDAGATGARQAGDARRRAPPAHGEPLARQKR
jgi:phosphonate transport system substrate-binding protein